MTATVSTASRIAGMDSIVSTRRMMTVAVQPRNQPAARPSDTPTSSETATDRMATAKDARAP